MMNVIRAGGTGPSTRAQGTITGGAWRDAGQPSTDGVAIGRVFFEPCSRTHWHAHEGGQLLVIVAGYGFVGDQDGTVRVEEGDMVWTPPGVRHWHGAGPDRFMVHTAIAIGETQWDVAVTEEEYSSAP